MPAGRYGLAGRRKGDWLLRNLARTDRPETEKRASTRYVLTHPAHVILMGAFSAIGRRDSRCHAPPLAAVATQ